MKTLLAAALVALSLSACAVYTPEGAVVIGGTPAKQGGGGFCPPGQAKKGNC